MLMTYGTRRNGKTLEIIRKQNELLNQAVEDIRMLGRMGQNICPVCANYNHGEGSKMCISCPKMDNFRWRGVVEKEDNK